MRENRTYRFPFAAYPALRLCLLLSAGIVAAHLSGEASLWMISTVAAILFLLWVVAEWRGSVTGKLAASSFAIILYSLMVVCFGAFWYSIYDHKKQENIKNAEPLGYFEWEELTVHANVQQTGWSSGGRELYELVTDSLEIAPGVWWVESIKMRIYGDEQFEGKLQSGQAVEVVIRVFPFPEKRNPHDFDYGGWLTREGIQAHGDLQEIRSVKSESVLGWEPIRATVRNNIDAIFDEEVAPLAKALFLGYKQELTQEKRQEFSRAGLSHIMAVSGLHVGFIVAPFWLIIPWLWGSRWKKRAGLLALTLLLIGYAGLTDFSASVSRASLMAWLLTFGKLFHKVRFSINVTAFAAIVLLLFNPGQLFNIGFQLSFGAVFMILLVMPEAQRVIPMRFRFGKTGSLLTIIIVSFVVQLGLFPILTHYFGEFSIVGPAANAFVIPLLAITVPAGLILSLFGGFSPAFFATLSEPVSWSINWVQSVAAYFGRLEHGYLSIEHESLTIYMVWAIGAMAVSSMRIPAVRWKVLIVLLILGNVFLVESLLRQPSAKKLTVTMLDVGQADAIHVKTPSGKNILIDTGRWTPMGNSGERVLKPYLDFKGINKLDAVILSHPHADHIGGLPYLMENMPIGKIYHSDYPYDSQLHKRYNELSEQLNIPLLNVGKGDVIDVDPAIRLFVVGPSLYATPDRNPNNHSVVIRLQYGNTSFLFTGDAEREQEQVLADVYGEFLNTDFLKVGHHGSRTSSTKEFINLVSPQVSAASLSFRNQFGHPGREAVQNIHQAGSSIYFTSLEGGLRFVSDGNKIKRVH